MDKSVIYEHFWDRKADAQTLYSNANVRSSFRQILFSRTSISSHI